jgi:hypothetical protein
VTAKQYTPLHSFHFNPLVLTCLPTCRDYLMSELDLTVGWSEGRVGWGEVGRLSLAHRYTCVPGSTWTHIVTGTQRETSM